MAGSARYADGWWQSPDGLRLHYRDYPGDPARLPVLCLPGLTRNARDFEVVAERLSPGRRVICVDLRGRGESAYASDPASYTPATYVADIEALFEWAALPRLIVFGTSLGGILAMLLAATAPQRIAGALLNDIGPVVEPSGLSRIKAYVGRGGSWPTWVHAARHLAEAQRDVHPGFSLEDWLGLAKRLCRLTPAGRIVFDYDMRIAEPMRAPDIAPPPDLWPALDALAARPILLVRGETSDILSAATAEKMAARAADLEIATVPATGHAPTLGEPEVVPRIDAFLTACERSATVR